MALGSQIQRSTKFCPTNQEWAPLTTCVNFFLAAFSDRLYEAMYPPHKSRKISAIHTTTEKEK